MRVDVTCEIDQTGEQVPKSFALGPRRVTIAVVLDRWLAFDHRYFKVRDESGDEYILRHDMLLGVWDLTLFRSSVLAT